MAQYIDKDALVAEIEKRLQETESMQPKFDQFWAGQISAFKGVLKILDTLEVKEVQEESVSEDLEEAAWLYYDKNRLPIPPEWDLHKEFIDFFKAGAQWQKENLWKPADGDDLPEVDREVIALVEENEHYKVVFAHRPPEYWDGKNILTGKVTRYEPKRYDKGGWNIPDVRWWLDVDLPKMDE